MSRFLPLISIIIPTYNRAHLISETLNSICTQTYQNWECIIVDDGSIDNTYTVVDEFIKKDKRFQFSIRPKNRLKGGNAARNYGFEISKGDYIIWYDSDDAMLSEKLESHINLFIENPKINVSVLNSYYYNFTTNNPYAPWRKKLFSEDLLNDFIIQEVGWQTGDALWKRSDLKFLFNESLQSSQDWEFHAKNIILQINIGFKDVCMSYIRHTPDSIKNSNSFSKAVSEYNSRKSVLNFDRKKNQINKKGWSKILNDLNIYFYFFWSNRKMKLSLMVLKDILSISFKLRDYSFLKKFILYYPNKIFKNGFNSH